MTEKELMNNKVLQKIKDLALDEKFEPMPKNVDQEHWSMVMMVKGFIHYLNSVGYEIRKKD